VQLVSRARPASITGMSLGDDGKWANDDPLLAKKRKIVVVT
jgi:hypothetical protein